MNKKLATIAALCVFTLLVLFGLGAIRDDAKAQPQTCRAENVTLTPHGNLMNSWSSVNRSVKIEAKIWDCENEDVTFRVWGRGSFGDIVLDEDTFRTTSDLVLLDDTFLVGEDGCVSTRVPQCQYFVTFSYGVNNVQFFTSQGSALQTRKGDVLGFNCDGGSCDPLLTTQVRNITGLTALQSTYDIILNTSGNGTGQVYGAGTYPVESEINVNAAPGAGSYFVEWKENGSTVSTVPRIKVKLTDQNRTLTAEFASGTAPTLPGGPSTPDGPCTIGPVTFTPYGNLLFGYPGGGIPVNVEWYATNCYGKTLRVTLDTRWADSLSSGQISPEDFTFDDTLFGFTSAEPYSTERDLMRFVATTTLGETPCDENLFPNCQYFFEVEDISPVSALGVIYTSRFEPLRTTGKDVLGFQCVRGCAGDQVRNPDWTWTQLNKEHRLTLDVVTNNNPSNDTGGRVEGEGVFALNSEVNVVAIPNGGYRFQYWRDEYGNTYPDPRIFVKMDPFEGDRTLEAHFTSNTNRNVNVTVIGGGTVQGAGGYPQGSQIELEATADRGWRFVSWRQEIDHDNDTRTPPEWTVIGRREKQLVTIGDSNITIEAVFEEMGALGIPPGDPGDPGDGLVPCKDDCDYNFFIQLVENAIDYIFILVLPIAALMAVVTGIMILTSGGNPSRLQASKKAFGKFLIGVIVVMVAWLIVASILRLLGVEGAYSFLDI